jgi:uncharacterized protein
LKSFVVLIALTIAVMGAGAAATAPTRPQGAVQSAKAADGQASADHKKEEIRKLLDLIGTRKLVMSSMDGMMNTMRPVLENSLPPGEYRPQLVDLFMAKFKTKIDLDRFVEMAAAIYDKHFTGEEIEQLVAFYQSPVGRKLAAALPDITDEMRVKAESWGRELGQDAMREVLAEHPDIASDMQAAASRLNVK